jgi:hypothetical protein
MSSTGGIRPTDVNRWCRVTTVDGDGTVTGTWLLEGRGRPDLGAVDDLARQALAAVRLGERLVLHDVSPELAELLELAGLPLEVQGSPGSREQPAGRDDPPGPDPSTGQCARSERS